MVNQQLAELSDLLVGSAMIVYTGALLSYCVDLSNLGVKRAAPVAQRELVASGGDVVVDLRDDDSLSVDDEAPVAEPAPPRRRAAGIALALTWLAFALHVATVVTRGLAAGRVPWGNMYEFGVTGSMVVTAAYLGLVVRNRTWRALGAFIVGPVLLTLGACVMLFYTVAARLVPALQSNFLIIHVTVAFTSTALFTIAFSVQLLQLVQQRRQRLLAAGGTPTGAFMNRVPSAESLEQLGYRLVAISFPLWTFTLVAGAIWAEFAWNRYWGWDPKEVWTFVIWVVYAAYLHARVTRGWDGTRSTLIALAGFVCVIINYAVVNVFFTGMHSYAGIG